MKTKKTGFSLNHLLGILIGAIVGAIIGNHCLAFGLWTMFVAPLVGALTFLFVVAPKQTIIVIQESWSVAFQFAVSIGYRRLGMILWRKIYRGFYVLTMSSIPGLCISLALSSTLLAPAFFLFGLNFPIQDVAVSIFLFSFTFSICILLFTYENVGWTAWDDFRKELFQASIRYLNFISIAYWMFVGMYVVIKWLVFTAIPWVFIKLIPITFWLTLRFSIEVQGGLRKHGLALGTLSTATGAFIGQFQNNSIMGGGVVGCGVYSTIHILVWCVTSVVKILPQRLVYEKVCH